MRRDNKKSEREGIKKTTNEGYIATCTNYDRYESIVVKFENGVEVSTNWGAFCKGQVKNPYHPTRYGIGYLGEGCYKSGDATGESFRVYKVWQGMLERCYSTTESNKRNNSTYADCTVDEVWHNYQNFAKWYEENYYELAGHVVQLDKDILIKGNKVYSPTTCIFVPQSINACITSNGKLRGDLPLGVTRKGSRFRATVNKKDSRFISQTLSTPEEAFVVYKTEKEKYIKELAEKYKYKVPDKLYQALLKYEVEITD